MRNDRNKDLKFSDIYSIMLPSNQDISVVHLPFSVRLKHVLMNNHVTTLSAILDLNISEFEGFRNLGTKTAKELHDFLAGLTDNGNDVFLVRHEFVVSPKQLPRVIEYTREQIFQGDFSFLARLNVEDRKIVEKYMQAYEILGGELIEVCKNTPEAIMPFMQALFDFVNENRKEIENENRIRMLLDRIPENRRVQKVSGYINAYTYDEAKRQELCHLYNLEEKQNANLKEYNKGIVFNSDRGLHTLLKFLDWCSFDVQTEIAELFEQSFARNNLGIVLKGRACGKTLQELGDEMQISRERVRQIEKKAKRIFNVWQGKHRILSKISALRNADVVLSAVELREYFGDHHNELLYLLRYGETPFYRYDSQLDVFVLGDSSTTTFVLEFVESLPSAFGEEDYETFLNTMIENEMPIELFEKAFAEEYRKDGLTYHRIKQTLTEIYALIMQSHFQHGLSIYEEDDMREFRRIAVEEYGCSNLPENDRAIYTRIQDICIMCDKGKYKPKAKEYISQELADKIHSYIVDSSSTIFLTNVLFNIFEDELLTFGISNKYYMQAVVRELYGNEFFFRKDYISKDDAVTNLNFELLNFIKKSDYPLDRSDFQAAFPGLTEIVLQMAITDPSVVALYGKFIHGSKLPLVESDRSYFISIINKFLNDDGVCHYDDIYKYIVRDDEDLLRRLFINIPTSLFSVLEYLFREDYQFKRPFIAKQGVTIENPAVQLKEIILSNDMITFADITEFMKEARYQVYSYLDYYNSFSDTHLIASSDALATFEYLGIDENLARTAVDIIEENVTECRPIRELSCIYKLPHINVPWHEWLIYSVIRKWSKKMEIGVSNAQFKYAMPLIAPKGCMDASKFGGQATTLTLACRVDDLDNIDELIEDLIDFEEDL